MAHYYQRNTLPRRTNSFSDLISFHSKKIALIGTATLVAGGFGAYQVYQSNQSQEHAANLQSVASKFTDSQTVLARETKIISERKAQSATHLSVLDDFEGELFVLYNTHYSALKSRSQGLTQGSTSLLNSFVSAQKSITELQSKLPGKASGNPSSGEWNELFEATVASNAELKKALDNPQGYIEVSSRPVGFASKGLEAFNAQLEKFIKSIPEDEAKLRAEMAKMAPELTPERINATTQKLTDAFYQETLKGTRAQAQEQINAYVSQVHEAAGSAFRRHGESMSSYDWESIKRDMENSADWQQAVRGLNANAEQAALAAKNEFASDLQDEAQVAKELSQTVAQNPETSSALPIAQAGLLYFWLRSSLFPTHSSFGLTDTSPSPAALKAASNNPALANLQKPLIPHTLLSLLNQRASLMGTPRSSISVSSHLDDFAGRTSTNTTPGWFQKGASFEPKKSSTLAALNSGTNSNASSFAANNSTDLSRNANAAYPKAMAESNKPAAPIQMMDASGKNIIASVPSIPVMPNVRVMDQMKTQVQKAAAASAQSASLRATQSAANSAANSAATLAGQRASMSAAQEASRKATEKAAQTAATKAAQKASAKAADRASQVAAQKAAQKASKTAADKAAQRAAQTASSKASSKASTTASSRSSSRSSTSSSGRR